MNKTALARQAREPVFAEARPGSPPDGPAELWFLVFATDGAFMGAAPAPVPAVWLWRNGHLCLDYSPVRITVRHGGFYGTGLICAVSGQAYRPLWPLSLGTPQKLRAGDFITITDGVIILTPELPEPLNGEPVTRERAGQAIAKWRAGS